MYQRRTSTLKYDIRVTDATVFIVGIVINALATVHCIQTAQKLIKDQFVDCHSNAMEVHLRFVTPFNGFIYVENYHEKPACSWYGNLTDYMRLTIPFSVKRNSSSFSDDSSDRSLTHQHDADSECGATVDSSSGRVTAVLVVSPLVGVLVSGTTNLQVSCLYTVKDFTVSFPRVHIVPVKAVTDLVTGLATKPILFMQILDGHGIGGVVLTAANIGQLLTLDVVLENAAIYDFTIYSCIAHDGSRSPDASVQIVDANGCGVPLIRAIEGRVYNATVNGAKHTYIYFYGFQFTSSQFVHFECQARTCVHSCLKQQCTAVKSNMQVTTDQNANSIQRRDTKSSKQTNLTLYTILKMKPQAISSAKLESTATLNSLLSNANSPTMAAVTAAIALALVAVFYACYRKRRERSVDMNDNFSESSLAESSMFSHQAKSFVYL